MNAASPTPQSQPRRRVRVVQVNPAATRKPRETPLLRVWVAGNPASGNHMYITRKAATGALKRAKVMTPTATGWRDAVAVATMPWRFAESAPRPTLAVSCSFVGARADVDNLLKLTLDGLKMGLLVDDRYVMRVCAEKVPLPRDGERGAWIAVSCLPPMPKAQRAPRSVRGGSSSKRTA